MGVPEDRPGGFFLDVEQIHFAAQPAMVAPLRLFQLKQVGVEFLLVAPGRAVDACQHRVAVVAAPIRPGNLLQLERRPDIAGATHMRTAAKVDPIALLIHRDRLGAGQVADQLGLVALATGLEEGDGLVPIPHFTLEGGIAGDDLPHPGLDGGEILGA